MTKILKFPHDLKIWQKNLVSQFCDQKFKFYIYITWKRKLNYNWIDLKFSKFYTGILEFFPTRNFWTISLERIFTNFSIYLTLLGTIWPCKLYQLSSFSLFIAPPVWMNKCMVCRGVSILRKCRGVSILRKQKKKIILENDLISKIIYFRELK